jgi:hypothetical protein
MKQYGFFIQVLRGDIYQDISTISFLSFNSAANRFDEYMDTGRFYEGDLRIIRRWDNNPATDEDQAYEY